MKILIDTLKAYLESRDEEQKTPLKSDLLKMYRSFAEVRGVFDRCGWGIDFAGIKLTHGQCQEILDDMEWYSIGKKLGIRDTLPLHRLCLATHALSLIHI